MKSHLKIETYNYCELCVKIRPIENLIRLLLLEILSISYVCKWWKKTTSMQTCCKRNEYHYKICVPVRKCAKIFLTNMCDNCFAKLPDLLLGAYFSIPILDPDD